MTKSKKFSFILIGLMFVIANFLFVGCGKPDYSKTSLLCSYEQEEIASIDLTVGEEKFIDFTIVNPVSGMSGELQQPQLTNPYVVDIEEVSQQDWTRKFKITGKKGGASILTMTTVDGNKSARLEINVKQYATSLTATDENLFLTETSPLVLSPTHFNFGDGTTEKSLKYYFYGTKKSSSALDIESVKSGNDFVNEFSEIKVHYDETTKKSYLVFTDVSGGKYSISSGAIDTVTGNTSYQFVNVGNDFNGFKSVSSGDEFYFVAVYQSDNNIFCERKFTVLKDIEVQKGIQYSYQVKNNDTILPVNELNFANDITFDSNYTANRSLVLVPRYTTESGGNVTDYKVAYLKITTSLNSLLKLKTTAENSSLLSGRIVNIETNERTNTNTYYIEISCSSGQNIKTNYDINFYYEGYENSTANNVNLTLKVPVEIKVIPQKLLINGREATDNYIFYNFYRNDAFGWQEFRFSAYPSDAKSEYLTLNIGDDLQVKYKGKVYSQLSESSEFFDKETKTLTILDLDEAIFVKGRQGSEVNSDGKLNVKLFFKALDDSNKPSLDTDISYQIVQGASEINFVNPNLTEGVYIDFSNKDFQDASMILKADASFSKIYFNHVSGENVAAFQTDNIVCEKDAVNNFYCLKFKIASRILGEGAYLISLDNGVNILVKVICIDVLNSVEMTTTNQGANLIGEESLPGYKTLYIKNDLSKTDDKLDIKLVANSNSSSKAIQSFILPESYSSNIIRLANEDQNNKSFDIVLSGGNGATDIKIEVNGNKITNFERAETKIEYTLHIVSFSYIDKLTITKKQEGGSDVSGAKEEATNSYAYFGTSNANLRQVSFNANIQSQNAFLFAEFDGDSYLLKEETFNTGFIIWEYEKSFYNFSDNTPIINMSGIGYFNMQTLSFTANENIENIDDDAGQEITLIARVIQYGKTFSFTINIKLQRYKPVNEITLDRTISEINLSLLNQQKSLYAFAGNTNATNPKLIAYFKNNSVGNYEMFEVESIESEGKFLFTISAQKDFSKVASSLEEKLSAKLYIVAEDWMSGEASISDEYISKAVILDVNYQTGTEINRYSLTSADDFKNFDLKSHYKLSTTIDVSSVLDCFPLERFEGSIVATSELAEIRGLDFNDNSSREVTIDGTTYKVVGMFTEIAEKAYIDNVIFSGSINLKTHYENVKIGLVAGENKGTLRNISVKLSPSELNIISGDVGGVVGINSGEILQDYSFTSLWKGNGDYTFKPIEAYKTLLYADDFVVVGYSKNENGKDVSGNVNFGGVTGKNTAKTSSTDTVTIRKIDAPENKTFVGYSNYFAYANMKAQKYHNTIDNKFSDTVFCVGGVAGTDEGGIAGYQNNGIYQNYSTFSAGKGLIVGGYIEALGYNGEKINNKEEYLGGVAGKSTSTSKKFVGLTSRMRLCGDCSVAGIANGIKFIETGWTAYALQAVENGQTGYKSSMIVLLKNYNGSSIASYSLDYEDIAFGKDTRAEFFKNKTEGNENDYVAPSNAFKTFLMRNYETSDKISLDENGNKSIYYGDYLIIGGGDSTNESVQYEIKQRQFTQDTSQVSVNAKLIEGNKTNSMTTEPSGNKAFYAYYFQAGSVAEGSDLASVQKEFDEHFNKLSSDHKFYPVSAVGELKLTSLTPDILEIDSDGRMTIKGVGLAQIKATSILNFENSLTIYIYVVNYFNSLEDISIVYPTQSSQSTKVDKTEILVIANNSTSLYVIPDYSLEYSSTPEISFNSNGEGRISNVITSLSPNREVTANVTVTGDDSFAVNVIDNEIMISKGTKADDAVHDITITPKLKFSVEGSEYTASVNKTLYSVTAKYEKGATDIKNKVYDQATIHSSSKLVETIILTSTYQNISEGDKTEWIDIKVYDENRTITRLFKPIYSLVGDVKNNTDGTFTYTFSLEIKVNTDSQEFKERSKNNIYQTYTFVISSKTNPQVSLSLPVTLEKTDIKAITITNYKNKNISSSTEVASPGEQGYLAISLSPIDGDFDYILIENADSNYQTGNSSAVFGLSALKDGALEDQQIVGSLTAKGLKLTRKEIEDIYSHSQYQDFNGTLYVNYIFGTNNVVDGSISNVVVSAYKQGHEPFTVIKPLTIKLPYFAKVTIENKELENETYYAVAKGLEYKLNLETYGYNRNQVVVKSSNEKLGTIYQSASGDYYLKVASSGISYVPNANKFKIEVETTDPDRAKYTSDITVEVREYVVNYNGQKLVDKDIVSGMGDGIINIQIGSALKLEMELEDYIEYDRTNIEVETKVKSFMNELVEKGTWTARTNLNSSGTAPESGKTASTGKQFVLGSSAVQTYYFKYSDKRITPIKTHEAPSEKNYYITFVGKFSSNNGVYTVDDSNACDYDDTVLDKNIMKTKFSLNVFTSSSDQTPVPIFEYKDLLKMHEGGYYILLNNIIVPNEETTVEESGEIIPAFSPITAKFASLDGNGLSIIFNKGKYDVGESSNIGLFESLTSGSVIKNLTVSYQSSDASAELRANGIGASSNFTPPLTYFQTSATNITFGGIVAQNQGAITNCKVETTNGSYVSVYAPQTTSDTIGSNYIGLIAGQNDGFITNSTVSVCVQAPFNIGGIAGTNNGKISGCAFKEGVITNILSKAGAVAGITVLNNENGQILTSFVRGKQNSEQVMSSKFKNDGVDLTSIISSPYSASGFVYQNKGSISDCYTDINLQGLVSSDGGMGYKVSGFVGQNGGQIRNSYSVSLLPSNRDSSSGFAESNSVDSQVGSFANCYYLSDTNKGINIDLKSLAFEGVVALELGNFDPENGKFVEYAHKKSMNGESVWFYPNGGTNSDYVEYSISGNSSVAQQEEIKGKDIFIGNVITSNMIFAKGRLELVNPSIKTLSRRIFDYSEIDEESGDIIYHYYDKEDDTPIKGSLHNPRLIYNAQTMEEEILNSTSKAGLNTSNYRLISDVDYSSYEGSSNLYTVNFAGIMEGNGMTISSIGLESTKSLKSAGMFASVGYSQGKRGTLKNLSLEVARVNFSETACVGAVAGTLRYGELHGISVTSSSGNGTTVLGQNFVGGIVGKAVDAYEITDVYSELNASSVYIAREETVYSQYSGNDTKFSYAGSIAGYLGSGNLYNARSGNIKSIVGGKAGFVFGGIGQNANVNYVYLEPTTTSTIKANLYAGLVAGEVAGNISHVYVSDSGVDNDMFDISSRVPIAVGGITGRLSGGEISNAVIYQTLNVSNVTENGDYIQIVGGLVGRVNTEGNYVSKITDSITTADIIAKQLAGGAVGEVSSTVVLDGIAVKAKEIKVSEQTVRPCVGGIVAMNNNADLTIKNSYCHADITIDASTSGIDLNVYAGGLVAQSSGSLTMSYCYTTSCIDVDAYDSRAVGDLKDFSMLSNADNIRFKKTIKSTQSDKIDNVYFYGNDLEAYFNKDASGNIIPKQESYIWFRSKSDKAKIRLYVDCYGKDSQTCDETIDNAKASLLTIGKGIFNNLFINRYKYNNDTYYKKSDIPVKDVLFTGFQKADETWVYSPNDKTKVVKRIGNTTLDYNNWQLIENFKPIAVLAKWNTETWGELTTLLIETKENLAWLNKATLGKQS